LAYHKYDLSNLDKFDEYLGETDSAIKRNGVKESLCYQCFTRSEKSDSCSIRSVKLYDTLGRLVKAKEGNDISNGQISLFSSYDHIGSNLLKVTKKYFPAALNDPLYNHLQIYNIQGAIIGAKFPKSRDGSITINIDYFFKSNGSILKKRYDYKRRLIDTTLSESQKSQSTKVPNDSTINNFSKTYTYIYNDSSHFQLQLRQSFNNSGKIIEKIIIEFDAKKLLILSSQKTIYLYDISGNLIKEILLTSDNIFSHEKTYRFDENGRLSAVTDDNPELKKEVSYDNEGRIISIKISDPITKNTRIDKFFYNSTGLLEREEILMNSTLSVYKKYEYKK
jgi:hypothetical protein